MGPLNSAFGEHVFGTASADDLETERELHQRRGSRSFVEPILAEAALPLGLSDAPDDESWDEHIRNEGDEALALTGKDVGIPVIHFEPAAGVAFFGPVISRLPAEDQAGQL